MTPSRTRLTLLAATALALTGCGGSTPPSRLALTGTVTLDGTPLETGYVTFEPKGGQQTQAGATITAGKFETAANSGAAPGPYAVAIVAGPELPPSSISPGTPEYEAAARKLPSERIPKKYNVNTTLVAEVVRDGENAFHFDLSSK